MGFRCQSKIVPLLAGLLIQYHPHLPQAGQQAQGKARGGETAVPKERGSLLQAGTSIKATDNWACVQRRVGRKKREVETGFMRIGGTTWKSTFHFREKGSFHLSAVLQDPVMRV